MEKNLKKLGGYNNFFCCAAVLYCIEVNCRSCFVGGLVWGGTILHFTRHKNWHQYRQKQLTKLTQNQSCKHGLN